MVVDIDQQQPGGATARLEVCLPGMCNVFTAFSHAHSAKTLTRRLQVTPVTIIPTELRYEMRQQIAVSQTLFSYALSKGHNIRALHKQTGARALLKGHAGPITDLRSVKMLYVKAFTGIQTNRFLGMGTIMYNFCITGILRPSREHQAVSSYQMLLMPSKHYLEMHGSRGFCAIANTFAVPCRFSNVATDLLASASTDGQVFVWAIQLLHAADEAVLQHELRLDLNTAEGTSSPPLPTLCPGKRANCTGIGTVGLASTLIELIWQSSHDAQV